MSYQFVEDLQKKAMSATTVNQACRILEVSRSGYYKAAKRHRAAPVVCAASVHLKAAFAASGRTYGSRRLRAALHTRGVTMGRHRVRSLMRAALHMAIVQRNPGAGLVVHSDRGTQYASAEHQALLTNNGLIGSMSRKGNCWGQRGYGAILSEPED